MIFMSNQRGRYPFIVRCLQKCISLAIDFGLKVSDLESKPSNGQPLEVASHARGGSQTWTPPSKPEEDNAESTSNGK